MRILFVNKFLYPNGGSETYIFKLGTYLKSIGHDVEYFGMEHAGRCVGNRVNAYTSDMDFHNGSKLSKIMYPVKTIYSHEARKKIRLVLDDFQPDVVHLNNFNYQLTPSIILEIKKWNKDCKIVYTAHDGQLVCPNHLMRNPISHSNCEKCLQGNFINCAKNKCIHGSTAKSVIGTTEALIWQFFRVYENIDRIICCSNFMKEKLDRNLILKKKTTVMHNFVDQVEWRNVEKKNYVLYFGRYSEEKGIDLLIEACKALPDILFVFAGSGPLENSLKNIANIKNVGFQSGSNLENLIRFAKFSICPSSCYENCPFSVMESQMYGTPVLGANIGGIPELIEVGKTGELFESGNKDDLISKIQYLYNGDLNLYTENCKNVSFYSIEEYCKRLIDIYDEKI